jgi:hypothetical protein
MTGCLFGQPMLDVYRDPSRLAKVDLLCMAGSVKLHSPATRERHHVPMRRTSRVGSAASPSPTVDWPNNEENGWPSPFEPFLASGPDSDATWIC